jgi:PEP-CTERM motif
MNRPQFLNSSTIAVTGFRPLNKPFLRGASMNRFSQSCRRFGWMLALAFGSPAIIPSTLAGEAQVGVRAFVQDLAVNASGEQSVGTPASFHPTASATALYKAGLSNAFLHADANALTGALHANYLANVGADHYVVGRNAFASGSAAVTGSITLSDGYPPGLATFSAILEGAYNFDNSVFKYQNSMSLDFSASVGNGPERNGHLDFDPFTIAGLFSVPMTWTQMVHPGERIDMYFYMSGRVSGLVGMNTLDVSNTFRLTDIDLPSGYTYTPDADGFLSEFQNPSEPPPLSPVPEPATTGLFGAAVLTGLAFRRFRRRSARASVELSGTPV